MPIIEGHNILKPLDGLRPYDPLPVDLVGTKLQELQDHNRLLHHQVVDQLRFFDLGKWMSAIESRDFSKAMLPLFKLYFANKSYSFLIPSNPPDRHDAGRTGLIFYMAYSLQSVLIETLTGIPTATVLNSASHAYPEEFEQVFRFVNFYQCLESIKSVQYEVEFFKSWTIKLIQGGPGNPLSNPRDWPYDSETMYEYILLGFARSGDTKIINSTSPSSPIVSAGVIRSYLESILLRRDSQSSLSTDPELAFDRWKSALDYHKQSDHISGLEYMWIKELYSLLSRSLHTGRPLKIGEVWALSKLVNYIHNKLLDPLEATPSEESIIPDHPLAKFAGIMSGEVWESTLNEIQERREEMS